MNRPFSIIAILSIGVISIAMPTAALNIQPIQEVSIENWSNDVEQIIAGHSVPVVIRGLASTWPAAAWTPEFFFANFPEEEINVYENYNTSNDDYAKSGDLNKFLETVKKVPLKEFGESFRRSDNNAYAIDKVFFEKHPELKKDLHFPQETDRFDYIIHFLFFGSNPTETDLHTHDSHYVFIAQLHGEKVATLISPDYKEECYAQLDNYEAFPHYVSAVDVENPDLEKYPKMAEAEFHQTTLKPGDVLYMPIGWFHDLKAKGPSISVSKFIGNKR